MKRGGEHGEMDKIVLIKGSAVVWNEDTYNKRQLFPTPVSPMMMYLKRYAYDDMSEWEKRRLRGWEM